MAFSYGVTEPAASFGPAASGDDDDSSVFSVDSGDTDDFLSADETTKTAIPLWQTLLPAQFSMAPSQTNIYLGELPEHEPHGNHGIYREVVILDCASCNGAESWIRLLQIRPGTVAQPIHCKLIKRPLWDAGEYNALSYSWGKEELYREIYLESQNNPAIPFLVSTHLWNALRRLRHEQCTVNVWVDVICIDQQNAVERAAQVNVMAQIFNQASAVRVWLGEVDILEDADTADWEIFWSLCQQPSPWWRRLWIVQECAYAKECPVVMFGAQTMSFEELIERWQPAIRLGSRFGNEQRRVLNDNFQFLRAPFDIWTKQKEGNRHRLPLSQRVQEMAGRKCTDPRDRIYALLSLIDENEAEQLRPDYRKPFPELLLEVAGVLRASPRWDEGRDSNLFSLLDPDSLVSTALFGERTPLEYCQALEQALKDGNLKAFGALMRQFMPLGITTGHWNRVLDIASKEGFGDVVQMLVAAGSVVNAPRGWYNDGLQKASAEGYEKAVSILIEGGANVNAPGAHYNSALYAASLGGYKKIVEMLIEAGADVNAPKRYNCDERALYVASEFGRGRVIEMLIEAGANVNAQGGFYGNALQAAAARGSEKVVRMLIEAGAHDNVQGGHCGSALLAASTEGHERVVKMLLEGGADVNAQGRSGNALQVASSKGHKEVAQMLIEAGAEVKVPRGQCGAVL